MSRRVEQQTVHDKTSLELEAAGPEDALEAFLGEMVDVSAPVLVVMASSEISAVHAVQIEQDKSGGPWFRAYMIPFYI